MGSDGPDLVQGGALQPEVLQHSHGGEQDNVGVRCQVVPPSANNPALFHVKLFVLPTFWQTLGHLRVLAYYSISNQSDFTMSIRR